MGGFFFFFNRQANILYPCTFTSSSVLLQWRRTSRRRRSLRTWTMARRSQLLLCSWLYGSWPVRPQGAQALWNGTRLTAPLVREKASVEIHSALEKNQWTCFLFNGACGLHRVHPQLVAEVSLVRARHLIFDFVCDLSSTLERVRFGATGFVQRRTGKEVAKRLPHVVVKLSPHCVFHLVHEGWWEVADWFPLLEGN